MVSVETTHDWLWSNLPGNHVDTRKPNVHTITKINTKNPKQPKLTELLVWHPARECSVRQMHRNVTVINSCIVHQTGIWYTQLSVNKITLISEMFSNSKMPYFAKAFFTSFRYYVVTKLITVVFGWDLATLSAQSGYIVHLRSQLIIQIYNFWWNT